MDADHNAHLRRILGNRRARGAPTGAGLSGQDTTPASHSTPSAVGGPAGPGGPGSRSGSQGLSIAAPSSIPTSTGQHDTSGLVHTPRQSGQALPPPQFAPSSIDAQQQQQQQQQQQLKHMPQEVVASSSTQPVQNPLGPGGPRRGGGGGGGGAGAGGAGGGGIHSSDSGIFSTPGQRSPTTPQLPVSPPPPHGHVAANDFAVADGGAPSGPGGPRGHGVRAGGAAPLSGAPPSVPTSNFVQTGPGAETQPPYDHAGVDTMDQGQTTPARFQTPTGHRAAGDQDQAYYADQQAAQHQPQLYQQPGPQAHAQAQSVPVERPPLSPTPVRREVPGGPGHHLSTESAAVSTQGNLSVMATPPTPLQDGNSTQFQHQAQGFQHQNQGQHQGLHHPGPGSRSGSAAQQPQPHPASGSRSNSVQQQQQQHHQHHQHQQQNDGHSRHSLAPPVPTSRRTSRGPSPAPEQGRTPRTPRTPATPGVGPRAHGATPDHVPANAAGGAPVAGQGEGSTPTRGKSPAYVSEGHGQAGAGRTTAGAAVAAAGAGAGAGRSGSVRTKSPRQLTVPTPVNPVMPNPQDGQDRTGPRDPADLFTKNKFANFRQRPMLVTSTMRPPPPAPERKRGPSATRTPNAAGDGAVNAAGDVSPGRTQNVPRGVPNPNSMSASIVPRAIGAVTVTQNPFRSQPYEKFLVAPDLQPPRKIVTDFTQSNHGHGFMVNQKGETLAMPGSHAVNFNAAVASTNVGRHSYHPNPTSPGIGGQSLHRTLSGGGGVFTGGQQPLDGATHGPAAVASGTLAADAPGNVSVHDAMPQLNSGDWFLKWTRRRDDVHRRYVWITPGNEIAWGKTNDPGSLRWLSTCIKFQDVVSLESRTIFDDATGRTFFVLLLWTTERTLQLGTEMRDKFDFWFDALAQLTAPFRQSAESGGRHSTMRVKPSVDFYAPVTTAD